MQIRPAGVSDLGNINDLYNRFVVDTHFTFDLEPMSAADRAAWFDHYSTTGRHRALVASVEGVFAGYATSSKWRPRPAYDTSVEVSIYISENFKRSGVATALYLELFEQLSGEDVHRAYAGIALPNAPSVSFHERMGFRLAGTLTEVGRKFGKWWDVGYYERELP